MVILRHKSFKYVPGISNDYSQYCIYRYQFKLRKFSLRLPYTNKNKKHLFVYKTYILYKYAHITLLHFQPTYIFPSKTFNMHSNEICTTTTAGAEATHNFNMFPEKAITKDRYYFYYIALLFSSKYMRYDLKASSK